MSPEQKPAYPASTDRPALFLVIECVTCGQPITDGSQAWRCCPEHHDKYGPGEWECAECVLETHMRMALVHSSGSSGRPKDAYISQLQTPGCTDHPPDSTGETDSA